MFLVNTGWIGGSPSSGAKRISIRNTRQMITSILNGDANNSNYKKEDFFGFNIPENIEGIESSILDPINSWNSKLDYNNAAIKLAEKFKSNFKIYGKNVEYLINSGPIV